ncbi:RpiB/LacA/LacB family sugar-phosphate isomerase [Candidatus Kaiserbacteria bacterium]|nr:RpiB/LacA/LacB family sugar-phosphate isomerase [Candidatus Kaiserbacteria bacterium]
MKVILAADHRGFTLKEALKKHLEEGGYDIGDMGASTHDPHDDYPDFAYNGALKVAENPLEYRGVFLCGSGIGMDVVANKVKSVRATIAYSPESARHARVNDDINVITIAADVMSIEEIKNIVKIFLTTPFSGEERHVRRLEKISRIEKDNFR